MSKPVPVSEFPDEVVCRPYRVKKGVPGLFDRPDLKRGQSVNVRRSPFLSSPRSYWIEDSEGTLLSVVTETSLRDCLEEVKG